MIARLVLVLLTGLMAVPVQAAVEEGRAKVTPWTGYWWPSRKGEMVRGYGSEKLSPMARHDSATGKKAEEWERKHHYNSDFPKWHGHCHAWSAASVLEPEPKREVNYHGVTFRVGDIKALLTEAHTDDEPEVFGERNMGGRSDSQDLAPEALWRVCREYIGGQGLPLLMDLDNSKEVWTYPVYGYQVKVTPSKRGADLYDGEITLTAADITSPVNKTTPDYVGTIELKRTYWFTVKMADGLPVEGSGKWLEDSRRIHPDYAWLPKERRSENKELDYDFVHRLAVMASDPSDPRRSGFEPFRPASGRVVLRAAEAGLREGGAGEVGPLQAGALQVGGPEVAGSELRALQVRAGEVRAGEHRAGEPRPRQVGPPQSRAAQVRPGEIGTVQVFPVQPGPG